MRVILVSLFILISHVATAQIEKGTFTIGGSLNGDFKSENQPDSESIFLRFGGSPDLGYFLFDNVEIVVYPFISHIKSITSSSLVDSERKETAIGLGIKPTKYFGTGIFKPFVGIGIHSSLDWNKNETINNDEYFPYEIQSKYKDLKLKSMIEAGILYFTSEKVSISFKMAYNHDIFQRKYQEEYNSQNSHESKSNAIYTSIGIGIIIL